MTETVTMERITGKIYIIQDTRVMLDRDLAELYGVKTKALKQSVRRNIRRFPKDFMFELSSKDFENWRSQFVTSNRDRMGLRYPPMAFTEQGIAMLSSVLNSDRAIEVNIEIMRAFVQLRKISSSQKQFARKLQEMEARLNKHDESLEDVYEAILYIINPPDKPKKQIGFEIKESRVRYGKAANKTIKRTLMS